MVVQAVVSSLLLQRWLQHFHKFQVHKLEVQLVELGSVAVGVVELGVHVEVELKAVPSWCLAVARQSGFPEWESAFVVKQLMDSEEHSSSSHLQSTQSNHPTSCTKCHQRRSPMHSRRMGRTSPSRSWLRCLSHSSPIRRRSCSSPHQSSPQFQFLQSHSSPLVVDHLDSCESDVQVIHKCSSFHFLCLFLYCTHLRVQVLLSFLILFPFPFL